MIAPARWAAYEAFRSVMAGRSDLPQALAAARARLPDERDRALAAEITTGTLRWLGALDHVIAYISGRRLDRLDAEVLDALRIGAYQIVHLTRVPPAAVVSDAVEIVRRVRRRSAAGLVNAVLRAVQRSGAELPLPPRPADADADPEAALAYLSITLSHPRWLVARWLARAGFAAAETWARFNNAPAPLALRANRLRTTATALAETLAAEGIQTMPARYAPDGLIVTSGNPIAAGLAGSGLFVVQDEASQLVPLVAQAAPGERVLDTCASPGGKTLALASDMRDRGLLVAADVRVARIALLRRTLAPAGLRSVRIAQLDASRPLPFARRFDCVLIDAPCSGLGTIRRDPEIRWRRVESDLARFADTQLAMLRAAADVVRDGGRIVYSTCSSEPEENDDVLARFLDARGDFEPAPVGPGPDATPAGLTATLDDTGRLRTLPHRHELEAFFGAVLRRR
jgi:16S rRNA (cytosine967-C5)-methyltransferase